MSTPMGGHVGIARAGIFVTRSSRWNAIAPLTACVASPYAHFVPRCLAAPVFTLGLAIWMVTTDILNDHSYHFLCVQG